MRIKILIFMMFISLTTGRCCFAGPLISVDHALKEIFPSALRIDKETISLSVEQLRQIEVKASVTFGESHQSTIILYKTYDGKNLIGYAFEDTVIGKWGPIHYLVAIDPAGKVLGVIVLDYQEIRGKPIAKKRFLNQYKGKRINDPIILGKDIDGITGATISSRVVTDGVRKVIFTLQIINQAAHP